MPKRKQQKKPSKDISFRSGFEKKVAAHLKENKVTFEYEQDKIPYLIPESKHNYITDFKIGNFYIEAKGIFDRVTRAKMALILEQNPDKDIRILFMRDNKIARNSKTKYSDWCKKRGIKFAVSPQGHIPEEWLNEAKLSI